MFHLVNAVPHDIENAIRLAYARPVQILHLKVWLERKGGLEEEVFHDSTDGTAGGEALIVFIWLRNSQLWRT
jgi:hypothetical protein